MLPNAGSRRKDLVRKPFLVPCTRVGHGIFAKFRVSRDPYTFFKSLFMHGAYTRAGYVDLKSATSNLHSSRLEV